MDRSKSYFNNAGKKQTVNPAEINYSNCLSTKEFKNLSRTDQPETKEKNTEVDEAPSDGSGGAFEGTEAVKE